LPARSSATTTMADRIICLRAGRIEQIGPPDDLYRRPQSLFIAGFIGSPPINMISGEARDGVMCVGSVVFPFEGAPGAVTVGLRPEHLRFTGSGLSGRIAQLEPMGREILYVVDTVAGYLRVLEHGSIAAHAVGEPVRIGFSPDDSLVFDTACQTLVAAARVGPPA
jgi:inositol-phosphate transport system ATP-binding protein